MSDSYEQAAKELNEFYQAVDNAFVASTVNALWDATCFDVLPDFAISATPTRYELGYLFRTRNRHYKKIASLNLPYQKLSGQDDEIPVTPVLQKNVELHTFHTVTIHGDGGVKVAVLIRDADNYVVAVKVYVTEEEFVSAPWLVFRGVKLPKRFKNKKEMKYGDGHQHISKMLFGKNTLTELVKFLVDLSIDPTQNSTMEGSLLFASLFLLLGEAQRFRKARNWTMRTIRCKNPKKVPLAITLMFLSWLDLSKTIFQLVLGLETTRAVAPEMMAMKLEDNCFMTKALKEWERCRKEHNDQKHCGLKFKNSEGFITLGCLLGGEVLLLRHDVELCTQILMRKYGFTGNVKLDRIRLPYEEPQQLEQEEVEQEEVEQQEIGQQQLAKLEVEQQELGQQHLEQLEVPQKSRGRRNEGKANPNGKEIVNSHGEEQQQKEPERMNKKGSAYGNGNSRSNPQEQHLVSEKSRKNKKSGKAINNSHVEDQQHEDLSKRNENGKAQSSSNSEEQQQPGQHQLPDKSINSGKGKISRNSGEQQGQPHRQSQSTTRGTDRRKRTGRRNSGEQQEQPHRQSKGKRK